ncbi:MAG TPA: hypothetical protein VE007_11190 [Thermoanaerobaculia bacterium]|nr:hypothetical protein [Thermoanaerobaculia bacterium]
MTPRSRFALRCAVALLSIGAFSLVFSLLAENGLWPELPPGSLHNTDLAAGFLAAAGLVVLLILDRDPGSRRSAG